MCIPVDRKRGGEASWGWKSLLRICFMVCQLNEMFVVPPVKLWTTQETTGREEGGSMTAILYLCLLSVIHRDVMWPNISGGQWHREQRVYHEREGEGVCGRCWRWRKTGDEIWQEERKRSMVKEVNFLLWIHPWSPLNYICIPYPQWHTMTSRDCHFTEIL